MGIYKLKRNIISMHVERYYDILPDKTDLKMTSNNYLNTQFRLNVRLWLSFMT